jgi:hypothetical protein
MPQKRTRCRRLGSGCCRLVRVLGVLQGHVGQSISAAGSPCGTEASLWCSLIWEFLVQDPEGCVISFCGLSFLMSRLGVQHCRVLGSSDEGLLGCSTVEYSLADEVSNTYSRVSKEFHSSSEPRRPSCHE